MKNNGLSTDSYKGVRDFYPRDYAIQNHIFKVWKKTAESFGYEQYDASILEPAELYKAKSGEEIVNEQTYTFTDRGDREVTLRPEMTPTLARMIAGKQRELVFPLRWFSIPNLFRYEQPQKGRLREHFQLNVDVFGIAGIEAEIEILSLARSIMKNFGAKDEDFSIAINNRKIINKIYSLFSLNEDQSYKVSKLIDKKNKISKAIFEDSIREVIGESTDEFLKVISSTEAVMEKFGKDDPEIKVIIDCIETLEKIGIKNVIFDPLLMRGFDYYTGIVFEVFDTNPENKRSMFGGGRYDDLLSIFGKEKIPAFGFGMGDVVLKDFLIDKNLLPDLRSATDVAICRVDETPIEEIMKIAEELRIENINVVVSQPTKKVGDQIKKAEKAGVPFIICVGQNEISSGTFELKRLSDGSTKKVRISEMRSVIFG